MFQDSIILMYLCLLMLMCDSSIKFNKKICVVSRETGKLLFRQIFIEFISQKLTTIML